MPIRGMEDRRELDQEKLRELAFIDDLTSLYNRRYLYRYLPTELKDTKSAGKKLCLFMMDIDNFKEVNDSHGHLCGDKILVEIAQILRKSLREGDTIVRYAGDELLAILPGAEEEVAIRIAERIIEEVDKTPFGESEEKPAIHLTISIGLAVFPRDAQDPEKLIYQADRALYSSKRSGRNRVCTTSDVSAEILEETKLQKLFPSAVMIGREKDLSKLKELLDEAEKGKAKFALIKGDRGVGKTRLINEFRKHAQVKGITNISASCSPEISTQPYQILIVALENLFASLGPEVREFIRSLPEAQIAQLANYIPSLKTYLPEDFKALRASTAEQSQVDLFKGICQSLIYIMKRNTLLLIIDDCQWIDKSTLQLFNYMVRDLSDIPILIIAACRKEELQKRADSASPKELLGQMQQAKLTNDLILGPLEREDIPELITTIFADIALVPEFADIVYGISAGNPLFAEEVLRSLVKKGLIIYQDGKWRTKQITEAGIPSFLKEAIQKRVSELDEETKPVIGAAAVIGEVFDLEVLSKVLGKDQGYILEVVDRAVAQHLIVPQSPFQTDKFKFSSGAIRDVIYEVLQLREKQGLHRKLALIEEDLYKDNIDSVAGNLGYHFDKAQDTEKADLYANVLLDKAKRMPTYEDVFGFLQEALMQKVEEIVVPLSDTSMKLVPAAIRSLRLATQNVRLYPQHSAIRKNFIDQAYKCLINVLDKDSTLLVGTAENRLLINGEEIGLKVSRAAGASAFVSLMINHRIKTITFKKGLTQEQLGVFLESLSQNFDELISSGGLTSVLRKKDISLIRVNEVRYEQTTKLTKQKSKFEEAMLMDYLIGKVSNVEGDGLKVATQIADDPEKLAEALKKMAEAAKAKKGEDKTQAQANIIARSLQKLSDEVLSQTKGGVEQYRKNITEAMMALDYKLRSKVIQAQGLQDDKAGLGDIIKDTLREFSDEEILKMVIKEFTESEGNLVQMRNFIRQFILDSRSKQGLLPKLKAELLQLGMKEEEVSWVLGEDFWQGFSLQEKVQHATKIASKDYLKLQKGVSEYTYKLVTELLENGKYSEAAEIIDKLIKQLQDQSQEVRKITVRDLKKISEMLIAKEKYFLLEEVIGSFINRLDKEQDREIYASIAEGLTGICARLLEKHNFIQATGILRELKLYLGPDSKLPDMQKQAIKEARDKRIAAPALVNRLVKLLQAKIEGHHGFYELSQAIAELGSPVLGPLFTLGFSKDQYVDPFKTYALRWSIARVLKGMSEEAVLYLKDRLADKRVEEIKLTLELFGHMQEEGAVKHLRPLLKHENISVRSEAVATLGKIGGSEAIQLLSESIKDGNDQIRLAAIWALADIGDPQVLPLLKPLLQDKRFSEEVERIIRRIRKDKVRGRR